jgi:CRP/FNR family transcriptional regulator, cyclic AMP receptor protein
MPTFSIFNNELDVRSFKAGETIFSEGDAGNGQMYAVLEGEVDIVRKQRTLAINPAGGLFGEMALLDEKPRSASAVAKTDCRLAAISEYRFKRAVMQNPQFSLEMMWMLVERTREDMMS